MCRPQRESRGRQDAAWQDRDELLGPDSRGVKGRAPQTPRRSRQRRGGARWSLDYTSLYMIQL
jgi:hypothetical protein